MIRAGARRRLDVLLCTIGSHGDVHPFVGLGMTLRERGHHVAIATNEHFKPLVTQAGLEFVQLGTDELYRQTTQHPNLWSSRRAHEVVFGVVSQMLRPLYDLVVQRVQSRETMVVGSSLAIGARVAQDRLGFPMATVHLSPSIFRSLYDPPAFGPGLPKWAPKWAFKAFWSVADRYIIDPHILPAINALREEVGLPPVSRVLKDYWHSPDLVIGMFPDWYAHQQSDWPAQTQLTGFPLFDESAMMSLPSHLEEFLVSDEPPVVFTPGSAMWQGREFFETSIEAARRVGRRAVLLTRHAEQIPSPLPDDALHIDYAPFSLLLPRVAALVHHGGIGTSAQALRAGVRQLVVPMAHDQFDNAARMQRLGVARVLPHRRYGVRRATRELRELLGSREYGIKGHWVREWFRNERPLDESATLIERMAQPRLDAASAA
jgi:rhamnosyltransferase subunit B